MKTQLGYLVFFFVFAPFIVDAQQSVVRLKGEAEVYNYVLERFVSTRPKMDKITVEWNTSIGFYTKKEINGKRIIFVSPINYILLVRKKKLKEVVIQTPIGINNGVFDISVCAHELSYNRKKNEITKINQGGVRLEMKFDCETGEFIVVSDSSLWK